MLSRGEAVGVALGGVAAAGLLVWLVNPFGIVDTLAASSPNWSGSTTAAAAVAAQKRAAVARRGGRANYSGGIAPASVNVPIVDGQGRTIGSRQVFAPDSGYGAGNYMLARATAARAIPSRSTGPASFELRGAEASAFGAARFTPGTSVASNGGGGSGASGARARLYS